MKKLMMVAVAMCIASPVFAASDEMMMDNMKIMTQQCMDKADTNGDKMVSRDEMDIYSKMKFKDADANNDNMISMDEMMVSHKKMHDEMMIKKTGSMDGADKIMNKTNR